MRLAFLLIFIAMPIAELALLIKLGGWIGFWPTLGLIIATALVGTFLLRLQGVATLNKVIGEVNSGNAPVGPMVEGVFLIIAGAFLLTPGIITDTIGGFLLIPPFRAALAKRAIRFAVQRGVVHVGVGGMRGRAGDGDAHSAGQPGERPRGKSSEQPGRRPGSAGPVIDGDFERVDEHTIDPNRTR